MPFNETPKHAEKVIALPQRTTSVSDQSALVMRIWVQQQEPATALPTTVNERAITSETGLILGKLRAILGQELGVKAWWAAGNVGSAER